jgi:hypothetical protein
MYSNYDFTRALVIDHQQQLHESAHVPHVGFFARRARRARARTEGGETRVAS